MLTNTWDFSFFFLDFLGSRTKGETLTLWMAVVYAGKSQTLRPDCLLRILALLLTDYEILGLLLTFPT